MQSKTFTITSFFAVFSLLGWLTTQTQAAPGDLDTTFGSGGKVFIPGNTIPTQVAVQPDGKIMVLGEYAYSSYAFLSRNNPDGTPDVSFGSNGLVFLRQFDEENYFFSGFVTLPDGKHLIVGEWSNSYALFRYNSNGTPDRTFGTNGILTTQAGAGYIIALQSDGKIITGGYAANRNFLIRYNPDGTLDSGFGGNGTVFIDEGTPTKILIQPDGKLLFSLYGTSSANTLIRYNADGTRDTGFGTNGVVNTGLYPYSVSGLGLQSNNKIVICGGSVMERYNANGTLDTSFGTKGRVAIEYTSRNQYDLSLFRSLAIQRNNKILTAGSLNGIFAVHRFNSDGTIDNTFAANGLVTTQLGSICRLFDITLQPDGKIVAVGDTSLTGYTNAGLVRYLGDPVEANPIKTKFDYDGDGRADLSVFRESDATWHFNNPQPGSSSVPFGSGADEIVPADYDGDGKTDIAVFRDGFWYWLNSSDNRLNAVLFGQAGDTPVPADYTGDGRAELAVHRSGVWYTLNLVNNQVQPTYFGVASDKPVPADYDGDGKTDIAVIRQESGGNAWFILGSRQGFYELRFGSDTDKPVPADYDGDGKTDVAVFRASEGSWHILSSLSNSVQVVYWGLAGDTPAPADYDGDGKADIAIYRGGVWHIRQSRDGAKFVYFGLDSDTPTNQVR